MGHSHARTREGNFRIGGMGMKHGFFLIDFLIYFSLFTLILWLLTTLVATSSVRLQQLVHIHNNLIQIMSADTIIKRILYTCPSSSSAWHVKSSSTLIWRQEDADCGLWYDANKNALMYCTGNYNAAMHTWRYKSKKVVATEVKDLFFEYTQSNDKQNKHSAIIHYTFRNTSESTLSIKNAIAVRNTVVYG